MVVLLIILCMAAASHAAIIGLAPFSSAFRGEYSLRWNNHSIWNTSVVPGQGDSVVIDFADLGIDCFGLEAVFVLVLNVPSAPLASLHLNNRGGFGRCRSTLKISAPLRADWMRISNNSLVYLDASTIEGSLLEISSTSVLAGTGVVNVATTNVGSLANLAPGVTVQYYGTLENQGACCWPGLNPDFIGQAEERYGTFDFQGVLNMTTSSALWIKDKKGAVAQHSGRLGPLIEIDQVRCARFSLTLDVDSGSFLIPLVGNGNATSQFLTWETATLSSGIAGIGFERRGGMDSTPIRKNSSVVCAFYCQSRPKFVPDGPSPLSACNQVSPTGIGVLLDVAVCNQGTGMCPSCLNGGECNELFGVCSCPLGTNGTTCDIPAEGFNSLPEALVLGLAIGIPLAVVVGVGVALLILWLTRRQKLSFTERANKRLKDQEKSDMSL